MNISKGHILEIKENGKFAKIQGFMGQIFDDVLLIYPYGFTSHIKPDDSALALLIYGNNSSTLSFAIPYDIIKQPLPEEGEVIVGDFNGSNKVSFKKDGSIVIESGSSKIVINKDGNIVTTTPLADFSASVNVATSYKVANVKVLGAQGGAIPDATGGSTVDAQARTAINSLLAACRTHGLIA